jgi:type IV pilus assembly protein PilY1
VSDGISGVDRPSSVKDLVAKWVGTMPAGNFDVDDLAWLARNRSIWDLSAPPASPRDYLSTHVIFTGPPCGAYSSGNCVTTDESVPEKLMQLTASKGGGRIVTPGNLVDLENSLRGLLQSMDPGSGSDVSILSTGDGSGAIFLKEQFYPTKSFEAGTSASWIGEMQSLWYYIDPFLSDPSGAGSAVREDTTRDFMLTLRGDRIVSFDPSSNTTYATIDANGDGRGGGAKTALAPDDLQSLWRAGKALWDREPSTRQLKTTIDGSTLIDFSSANSKVLAPFLNVTESEATKLVAFVLGTDQDGYRSRKVTITDPVSGVAATREWKLGDIISSTPQAQTAVPLGSYHLPPPRGYNDTTYGAFIGSSQYQGRGTVYVGANDGMLHAFNLGRLETGRFDLTTAAEVKAKLSGSDLGKEAWGFIPRNALPYLKYLADPNYRHLYFVDGKVTLVDAASGAGNAWRTILVGGMGLGGASAKSCPPGNDCVQTPVSDAGYSSYFALDVTDPAAPSLLWEFSDPALGYSTSGPAVVKTGGKWFAVFGSGPTGPIDGSYQFLGRSNQSLKVFAVELRSGALSSGGVASLDTGIARAFAGSLTGAAIDTDKWNPSSRSFYSDDAIYLGYTKDGSDGGVLRIVTNDSATVSDWKWDYLVQGTGPVTSGLARIQDRKNHQLWLYFGTGRYFFNLDDLTGARALYGLKDPCYHFANAAGVVARPDAIDPSCHQTASVGNAGDMVTTSKDGWRVDLAGSGDAVGAERVVSTPTATTGGAVFFPTFQPSKDPCLPGNSYLWELLYNSGAAPATALLHGQALLPLASGNTHDISLETAGGRGPAVAGRAGPVKIVSNNGLRPVKKIIHIQER